MKLSVWSPTPSSRFNLSFRPGALALVCGLTLLATAQAQDCQILVNADDLGVNTANTTRFGGVTAAEPGHFYKFTVAGAVSEVTALIPAGSMSAQLDLSLLRDANNNGVSDAADAVVSDSGGALFVQDRRITVWLDPGTYYIGVCGGGVTTGYQLTVTQTPQPASRGTTDNVRANSGGPLGPQCTTEFVSIFDTIDYAQFVVTDNVAEVSVTIPGSSLHGLRQISYQGAPQLCLKLFPWGAQGNEQVFVSDCQPRLIASDLTVSLWLDRGTYFVKTEFLGGPGGTDYQLCLTNRPKPFSVGNGDNSPATARLLLPRAPTNDFVGISDGVDYYKVVVNQSASIQATIPSGSLSIPRGVSLAASDIRLRLLQPSGGGTVELANSVGSRGHIGSPKADAVVAASVSPGTYYLAVEPANPSDNEDNTIYLITLSAPEPPLPGIQLSGDLNFGTVLTNSITNRTLVISNSGTATLNVSGINYSAAAFSGNFAGPIPPGGAQPVTVTFAAGGPAIYNGTLTVQSDAVTGIGVRPIAGTSAPPQTRIISLSGTLMFGNVESGRKATRTLTINNYGNSPLAVSGITYPPGFSGAFQGTIAPGSSRNVTVTFAPTSVADYGGLVTVVANFTEGTDTIEVSGTGTPALSRIIGLTGNLTFGKVEVGSNEIRSLVITNAGEATLTVSRIAYPEGFSGAFSGGIAAHSSRAIPVTFRPANPGVYTGAVMVISDASGGTNTIKVAGTGTPMLTRIIGLRGTLAFGGVQVSNMTNRTLIISNFGQASFAVRGISYPAGFSGSFTGAVPARSYRTVRVTFAPTAVIDYGGPLIVDSSATDGTDTIDVSGTGTPVPIYPREGTYSGLFRESGPARPQSSGSFQLTATRSGAYSARVFLAGAAYNLSGRFSVDGMAANRIVRTAGRSAIDVAWNVNPLNLDEITGLLITPEWEASLTGRRAVYLSPTNNAPQAGRYTLVLPGTPQATDSPEGDGFGVVTVSARGLASFAGTLADGTKVTQAAQISQAGDWPFHAALHGGRGLALSWLRLTNSLAADLSGTATWIRPPTSQLYPGGFAAYPEVLGWRYMKPPGTTNRVVAITNGLVTLGGAHLSTPLIDAVVLRANNTVSNRGPDRLTMTISTSNGLFSGSITPNGSRAALPFQGVILQRTNATGYGAGFFLQTNLSGRVAFEIER